MWLAASAAATVSPLRPSTAWPSYQKRIGRAPVGMEQGGSLALMDKGRSKKTALIYATYTYTNRTQAFRHPIFYREPTHDSVPRHLYGADHPDDRRRQARGRASAQEAGQLAD